MAVPSYSVVWEGESRSFPEPHAFIEAATAAGDVRVVLGAPETATYHAPERLAVVVELGTECLETHEPEGCSPGASNLVGFSRWRLGDSAPSNLIELVVPTRASPEALDAAQEIFEASGFVVSRCADRAGRILDRLLRPQFNLALTAVDDGLATAEDLDLCLKLGLGYRQGLLMPLEASGLATHHDVTQALFEVYGMPAFAPPRRAVIAKQKAGVPTPSTGSERCPTSALKEAGE